jgi:glyoxylase-like metal-dependent hydrolase (beta-lactamase superfamily II)
MKMDNRKEIHLNPVADGIYVIETYYLGRPGFACCYVMVEGDEAAVIETNTNHAAPLILGTLDLLGIEKKKVKYVILTHIHLDHAGGTGELMKNLPEAKLILHPRGKKHMIDPEKLIESVKKVYGEKQYKEFYGDIIPVPKESVITVNNGDTIRLGDRELSMFDTPGHAKHHIIIFDKKTNSVFSGDNFGIAYPRLNFGKTRLVFPSTSPTQFEPEKALETYRKIIDLEPSRVLLTHYGAIDDLKGTHEQLTSWIDFSVEIAEKRYGEGLRGDELSKALREDLWSRLERTITSARGYALTPEEKEWLTLDTELNAQGIAYYIDKPAPEINK